MLYFREWFDSILINEINEKLVSSMRKSYRNMLAEPEKNPLNGLFSGNKAQRFVIDFAPDKIGADILKRFETEGYLLDFAEGMAKKGTRKMRIGRVLLDKKYGFTDEEKKWWNTKGEAVKALQEVAQMKDKYAVVISRNPFDVLRMGDFEEIRNKFGGRSCHHPQGGFFYCAVEEVGHGAIAYVVEKKDLTGKDLDAEELFKDDERKKGGVTPISRLRIRRFVDDDGSDLGIPEKKVYGKDIPGFYNVVANSLKKIQSQHIEDKNGRPRLKDYKLAGGDYEDTVASDLFNSFFGDNLDRGQADKIGHGGRAMADIWDDEVIEINNTIGEELKHYSVYGSVEGEDNQPYVLYGAQGQFSIPHDLFNDQALQILKTSNWRDENYRLIANRVQKIISKITYFYIDQVEIDVKENEVEFDFNINDEGSESNPDSFRSFANGILQDQDKEYNNHLQRLMVELTKPLSEDSPLTLLKNPSYYSVSDTGELTHSGGHEYKHFTLKNEENRYDATIEMNNYEIIHDEKKEIDSIVDYAIKNIALLDQKLRKIYDPKTYVSLGISGNEVVNILPDIFGDYKDKPTFFRSLPTDIIDALMRSETNLKNYPHSISGLLKIIPTYFSTRFGGAGSNIYNQFKQYRTLELQKFKASLIDPIINLYLKYVQKEKRQSYLFSEPEFSPKLLMQKSGKIDLDESRHHIKEMLSDENSIEVDYTFSENRASSAAKLDRLHEKDALPWGLFVKININFDSQKFTNEDHEMMLDFAKLLDDHYNEFLQILRSQANQIVSSGSLSVAKKTFDEIKDSLDKMAMHIAELEKYVYDRHFDIAKAKMEGSTVKTLVKEIGIALQAFIKSLYAR